MVAQQQWQMSSLAYTFLWKQLVEGTLQQEPGVRTKSSMDE